MPPGKYNVHLEKFEDNKIQKLTEVKSLILFRLEVNQLKRERFIRVPDKF